MLDMGYIDSHKRCIFEAWKTVSKRIEQSVILGIVAAEVRQNKAKAAPESNYVIMGLNILSGLLYIFFNIGVC